MFSIMLSACRAGVAGTGVASAGSNASSSRTGAGVGVGVGSTEMRASRARSEVSFDLGNLADTYTVPLIAVMEAAG